MFQVIQIQGAVKGELADLQKSCRYIRQASIHILYYPRCPNQSTLPGGDSICSLEEEWCRGQVRNITTHHLVMMWNPRSHLPVYSLPRMIECLEELVQYKCEGGEEKEKKGGGKMDLPGTYISPSPLLLASCGYSGCNIVNPKSHTLYL